MGYLVRTFCSGVFLLLLLVGVSSGRREPWIAPPAERVDLTPALGVLLPEHVQPGSTAALLNALPEEVARYADALDRYATLFTKGYLEEDGTLPAAPDALLQGMAELRPLFEMAREIAHDPTPQVTTLADFNGLLPYLQPARDVVRALCLRGVARIATGSAEEGVTDFLDAVRFGNALSQGGVLIHHLVDIACTQIAVHGLWQAACGHELPLPVLQQAITACRGLRENTVPLAETLRWEWLCAKGGLELLFENPADVPTAFGVPPLAFTVLSTLSGGMEMTTANLALCYEHLVLEAQQPWDPDTAMEGMTVPVPLGVGPTQLLRYEDPLGLLLAQVLLPALGRVDAKSRERLACLALLETFLAVQAFETRTGNLPETLEDLVPASIETVPLDPFTARPLLYKRGPDRTWKVYSTGIDGRDNGGEAEAPLSGREPDLVMPYLR